MSNIKSKSKPNPKFKPKSKSSKTNPKLWHFFLKRNGIIDQCESWIRELQKTSSTEKRISSSISQLVAALIRHTNDLKKELNSLTPLDDLIIPSELTTLLLKTPSNNNNNNNNNTADQETPSYERIHII
ncbi:unnamed protein product [Rotaria magnacalcarata]